MGGGRLGVGVREGAHGRETFSWTASLSKAFWNSLR